MGLCLGFSFLHLFRLRLPSGLSPFGLVTDFLGSLSLSFCFPLPSGVFRLCRPCSLRWTFPFLRLLPCCLSAVGVLGLCSVPWSLVYVPVLLLCLSACGSLPSFGVFFIAASISGLLVLLGMLPCGFLLIHLYCLVRISVPSRRGLPLGRVSCLGSFLRLLLRIFCGPLYTSGWFRCRSLAFSLSPLFWASPSSSLPLPCAVFWCGASLVLCDGVRCPTVWDTFSAFCLSCPIPRAYCTVSFHLGRLSWGFSYDFPCDIPFFIHP